MKITASFDTENITSKDLTEIRKMLGMIASHVQDTHAKFKGKNTAMAGVAVGEYVYESAEAERLYKALNTAKKTLRLGGSLKEILK